MDPRANDATALADCLERKRDQGSHRRKDNRDVEKVGQQSVRTAFPLCLQAQSESLTGAISQPCERVDGTPLRFDNMRQNMGRGAEAEETDSLALAGDDQRTTADQAVQSSGADETSLPASPSGNAKRASATVAVAKPPTRLKPVLRHLAALLQRVLTVHQHFGLDDGDQPGFLAQCGVPGQSLRTGLDASSTRNLAAQRDHRPQLGKARGHSGLVREASSRANRRSRLMMVGEWMEIELAGDSIAAKIVAAEEITVMIELSDDQRWKMTLWTPGDYPHRPWVGEPSDDWTVREMV
jgi:hypothetical protein